MPKPPTLNLDNQHMAIPYSFSRRTIANDGSSASIFGSRKREIFDPSITQAILDANMRTTIPDKHCRGSDLRRPRFLVDMIKGQDSTGESMASGLPEKIDGMA